MNKASEVLALMGVIVLVALSSYNLRGAPEPVTSSLGTQVGPHTDDVNDVGRLKFGNAALPDLVVQSCIAPSSATRGSQIAVGAIVSNTSGLAMAGWSRTCFYWNTSSNVTGASFLGAYPTGPLGLHGSYTNSANLMVPSTQPTGLNYFLAVCDCSNNVVESIKSNNTNGVAITVN